MPLISVIIPVYNTEKHLKQCLDSIVNQSLKDIEIICIDDGSIDNSLNILNEYKEKDNRIIVLTQQNKYAGVARNTGLSVAKGKYLSFLDSDDFFELNMLEEMYNKAETDNSDIVICAWKNYHNKLKKSTKSFKIDNKYVAKSPFSPITFSEELFEICKPNPWTKLFKHDFFIENDLHFEDCICCNDLTCICTAMTLAKKISIINKEFVNYRISQDNSITANRIKNFDSVLYAINKLDFNLKKHNVYDIYKHTFFKKAQFSYQFRGDFPGKKALAKQMLSDELYKYVTDTNNYNKAIHNKKRKLF